jgi:serine/threonine protein kinase HipA of HipAB toxin-antitoxin module
VVAGATAAVWLWNDPVRAFDLAMAAGHARSGVAERFVEIDRIRWRVLETHAAGGDASDGAPERTCLVLHGLGTTAEAMMEVAPILAASHRVVIPDLPGFGDHPMHGDMPHDWRFYIDAIERFRAHEGLGQVDVVGTSMGGARPKTVVEDEEGLWLAKFNRPNDDRWNMARVEHAMLLLAAKCGVQVAKSRVVAVGERDVLLVKRFDRERVREGYRRSRMVSALTLLGAEDTAQSRTRWSYPTLVEQLRRSCAQARRDSHELFRRICFNALISNTDDHPRNHAFLAHGDDWQLSPAYDLTPMPHVSAERRDLAMEVGPAGRWANAENLVSEAPRFLLEPAEARAIVDTMEKQVRSSWRRVARKCGVSEHDCEQIARAFAYPGFRLPLT